MSCPVNTLSFYLFYIITCLREALLKYERKGKGIHSNSVTKMCNIFCSLIWFLYSTSRQRARLEVRLELRTDLAKRAVWSSISHHVAAVINR